MADWSLDDVVRLYERLSSRGGAGGALASAAEIAAALEQHTTAVDVDATALHRILTTLSRHYSMAGSSPAPSPRDSSWPWSGRRRASDGGGGLSGADGALRALCCGMAVCSEGSVAAKLEAGFALYSRSNTLDLHGLLAMLQGGMLGAQQLRRAYFGPGSAPPGLTPQMAGMLRFEWQVAEGLLRDGALAPLFQLERDLGRDMGGSPSGDGSFSARSPPLSVRAARLFLRGASSPKFSAAQLQHVLDEYISDLEGSEGTSVWSFAEGVLAERARSLAIDAALADDAQAEAPNQVLLLGRDGVRPLVDSLRAAYPVVPAHTRLGGSGIRQLCIFLGGRAVTLIDICGSHSAALAQPSRLRKQLQHFDAICGAIVVVGIDELCAPADAHASSLLLAAVASCLRAREFGCFRASRVQAGGGGAPADGPLLLPLLVLLAGTDLAPARAPELEAAMAELRLETGDALESAEAQASEVARAVCLKGLSPAAAESVSVAPWDGGDQCLRAAFEALAERLP